MHFASKSAVTIQQLTQSIGHFKDVELQLLKEFEQDKPFNQIIAELYAIICNVEINIFSIHTPLLYESDCNSYTLEDVMDTHRMKVMHATCALAQKVAMKQSNRVGVVVHVDNTLTYYRNHDHMWSIIRKKVKELIDAYDLVDLCFENVMPVCGTMFRNGFLFDPADIVRTLREELNTTHIYTVLDICHALASIRFLDFLKLPDMPIPYLKDFFVANGDLTRIIHFNHGEGLALTHSTHSLGFKEKDRIMLDYICKLHTEYTPQAVCVLEVMELDYETNGLANKLETLRVLDKLPHSYTL